MAVLTVLMCFASTNAFAQLKEVRGVQTRMVEYQSEKYVDYYKVGYNRHGFEFKNENNYSVWIEVELCTNGYGYAWSGGNGDYTQKIAAGTYDTKSFTLKAGETYVWKCGDKMLIDNSDHYADYYVKYKAYKAE